MELILCAFGHLDSLFMMCLLFILKNCVLFSFSLWIYSNSAHILRVFCQIYITNFFSQMVSCLKRAVSPGFSLVDIVMPDSNFPGLRAKGSKENLRGRWKFPYQVVPSAFSLKLSLSFHTLYSFMSRGALVPIFCCQCHIHLFI